jgi:hypothetical protein
MKKKDVEYFREFWEHPETFRHGDFYEMLNKWGRYIIAHKGDFDYINDEEWQEIRLRINDDLRKREAIAPELRKQHRQMCRDIASIKLGVWDERSIEILRRTAEFIKKYRAEFRYSDEDIFDAEEDLRLSLIEYEEQKAAREIQKRAEQRVIQALKNPDENDDIRRIVPFKPQKPFSKN